MDVPVHDYKAADLYTMSQIEDHKFREGQNRWADVVSKLSRRKSVPALEAFCNFQDSVKFEVRKSILKTLSGAALEKVTENWKIGL